MEQLLQDINPLDPEIVECPYPYYRIIRENGGVCRVPGRGFVFIGNYDLCMEVIRDTDACSSSAGVGVPRLPQGQHPEASGVHTLLTADPPVHRKYRELANKAFSLKRISSWEEDRRTNSGDDFISDLIRAGFDGQRPLDMGELASIVQQFLVAGNETTTNTIASGMWLLCNRPGLFEELRGDYSLIANFVEVVLRFESPVQCHFRRATRNTVLGGVEIPEGTGVGLLFGCANRDDNTFTGGEEFDVRRDNARRLVLSFRPKPGDRRGGYKRFQEQ